MLGEKSKEKLKGVDQRLAKIIEEASKVLPVQVSEGLRTLQRQAELVAAGKSKTMESKHLVGKAVDIIWIVDGKANWEPRNYFLIAGCILTIAEQHGVKVRWGGDWNSNLIFTDQNFNDLVHFEI